jgi:hypothetical protein
MPSHTQRISGFSNPDEYAIAAEASHHKPELIWHISGMLQENIKHCMR